MSLGTDQERFARDLALLITYAYSMGYSIRIGDVWAKQGEGRPHKKGSFHFDKCAADLNLFKDKEFLTETKDHQFLGNYWEFLDARNRWGGRFNDGNHYERVPGGWR